MAVVVVRRTVQTQETEEFQRRQVVDRNPRHSIVLWCADGKAFRRPRGRNVFHVD
jgi:hypothetical protein